MTANRRTRKTKNRRSTNDVDPYAERYRKASDAAKAKRDEARRREGLKDFGKSISNERVQALVDEVVIHDAETTAIEYLKEDIRIVSASLGGEGTSYERGDEGRSWYDPDSRDEAVRRQQGTVYDLVGEFPRRGGKNTVGRIAEEAFRSEATPDAAALGQRGASAAQEELPAGKAHKAFFEQEVNLVPTHIGTESCRCHISQDHWVEVGEN